MSKLDKEDLNELAKMVESAVNHYLDGMAKQEVQSAVYSYLDSTVRAKAEEAIKKELDKQVRCYFFDVKVEWRKEDGEN